MLMQERERELFDALDECHLKGVSTEAIRTLIYETGARWVPTKERKAA
jgi:hypothetical protein